MLFYPSIASVNVLCSNFHCVIDQHVLLTTFCKHCYKKDEKQLDAEIHRKYLFSGHVGDYMRYLAEEEPEKYQSHFSEYIKRGIDADAMEELLKKVHAAIRADPNPVKSTKELPKEHKRYNLKKLTFEERKNKLIERLNALNSSARADDMEDDEDDDE